MGAMTLGSKPTGTAREVAALFLRLGLTAFGGPAAHIAMFRDEVVARRGWVTDAEFLDLLAATNLIPGPNSTEMTIHLGYVRAGWRGLIAGGVAVSPVQHYEGATLLDGRGGPWNSFVFFSDPDGNAWAVQERPGPG